MWLVQTHTLNQMQELHVLIMRTFLGMGWARHETKKILQNNLENGSRVEEECVFVREKLQTATYLLSAVTKPVFKGICASCKRVKVLC